MKRFVRQVLPWLMISAVIVILVGMLVVPPWWGRIPYHLHHHWGIPSLVGELPSEFSGVYNRYYPDGALQESTVYVEGKRNGSRKHYAPSGKLNVEGEFRDDEPWEGICLLWDTKPYYTWSWGEFHNGQVWTGRRTDWPENADEPNHVFLFEGHEFSEDDVIRRLKARGPITTSKSSTTEQDSAPNPLPRP